MCFFVTALFNCFSDPSAWQLPGKVVGILKSSPNRDEVELLVSMAKIAEVPSQDRPGKKQKVRWQSADSITLAIADAICAHEHTRAFACVRRAKNFGCGHARAARTRAKNHVHTLRDALQTYVRLCAIAGDWAYLVDVRTISMIEMFQGSLCARSAGSKHRPDESAVIGTWITDMGRGRHPEEKRKRSSGVCKGLHASAGEF